MLAACAPQPERTVGAATDAWTEWRLAEVDGAPPGYDAGLRLTDDGRVIGTGPCGGFTARQRAPLPWVEIRGPSGVPPGCPPGAAADHAAFLDALRAMTLGEVAGDNLILSAPDGRSLYFRAAQPLVRRGRPAQARATARTSRSRAAGGPSRPSAG